MVEWEAAGRSPRSKLKLLPNRSRGLRLRSEVPGSDGGRPTCAFTYVYTPKSRCNCREHNPAKDAKIKTTWL